MDALLKYPFHTKEENANGLFNITSPSLPNQRLMIKTLDDTDFGRKVDFCGGRKTRDPGEKPFGVRLTSTDHRPRMGPGSNPGRSDGRCR